MFTFHSLSLNIILFQSNCWIQFPNDTLNWQHQLCVRQKQKHWWFLTGIEILFWFAHYCNYEVHCPFVSFFFYFLDHQVAVQHQFDLFQTNSAYTAVNSNVYLRYIWFSKFVFETAPAITVWSMQSQMKQWLSFFFFFDHGKQDFSNHIEWILLALHVCINARIVSIIMKVGKENSIFHCLLVACDQFICMWLVNSFEV